MKYNDSLIVLNTTRIKDNSIVLHTLSRTSGRKGYVVTVSKSSSMALFQAMNVLEADISENSKSTLSRASSFASIYPLNSIRSNFYKNSITMFMAEVLFRALRDGACEEGLYDWCVKTVLRLEALESDFSNYHLRFLLELASALGFSPEMDDLLPFAGERYEELRQMISLPFAESMLVPMSGVVRNEAADCLVQYLSFHLESQLNIQSLRVLREIYQ